jgi:uncharacterized protein
MKKFLCSVSVLLCLLLGLSLSVFASPATDGYVIDQADILTEAEEETLEEQLGVVRSAWQSDVVIVTQKTIDTDAETFADDYFDYNGYGYGGTKDGVLLLVSMHPRELWVSTRGTAMLSISENTIVHMLDEIAPMFSDARYYDAFNAFANTVESYLSQPIDEEGDDDDYFYATDDDYDDGVESAKTQPRIRVLAKKGIGFLAFGLLASLVIMLIVRSRLKKVHPAADAANYLLPFNLTTNSDVYLRQTHTSVPIPQPQSHSSSGGGSRGGSSGGGHISSSGASHGGGGRSF